MASQAEHDRDLAWNLMQTLGIQRAIHAAEQYGWYGVALAITELRKQALAAGTEDARNRPERYEQTFRHHAHGL